MIKTDAYGKTKIICDRCGYTMEFPTLMDAWVYLGGRGRLYGWSNYTDLGQNNILYCPVCAEEFEYDFIDDDEANKKIENFEALSNVESSFNDRREIIQMRLEMFQF